MLTTRRKLLIIAEEVNYDRTSCGLLNAKIIYAVAPHFDCTVLTEGDIPADFNRFYSGPLLHFRYHKPSWLRWLGHIRGVRNLVAYLTGMHYASFHKYLNWRQQLRRVLGQSPRYDGILQLGTGMGWYSFMAMASLPKPAIPLIGNIHDPFPMALLPPPYNPPWVLSERILRKKFRRYLLRCHVNWAPSQRLLEWMRPHYPALERQGYVMPHLALKPPFDPARHLQGDEALWRPLEGLHTRTHFLLVHMGSLLEGRTPKYFFEAVNHLLQTHPEAAVHTRVVFIGKVHPKLHADFEQVAGRPQFIIDYTRRISYQQSLSLQQAATANLTIEAVGFASPQLFGKFADSVLAGRIIFSIGPAEGEMRRLLGEDWPYQAANADQQAINQALLALYQAWRQHPDLRLGRPDLTHHCHPQRAVEGVLKMWE